MNTEGILDGVRDVLDGIADPCMQAVGLGLSVNDLGLVNAVHVDTDAITVQMTFTEVGCPFSMRLLDSAERALQARFPNHRVQVQPHWNPPWDPARLSARARAVLDESNERLGRFFPSTGSAARPAGPATPNEENA